MCVCLIAQDHCRLPRLQGLFHSEIWLCYHIMKDEGAQHVHILRITYSHMWWWTGHGVVLVLFQGRWEEGKEDQNDFGWSHHNLFVVLNPWSTWLWAYFTWEIEKCWEQWVPSKNWYAKYVHIISKCRKGVIFPILLLLEHIRILQTPGWDLTFFPCTRYSFTCFLYFHG